ncbi:glycosyltransferase family 2 protein [Streptomyces sp. NBC_01465]|uniref:glycosyltransferase family 2 protein n=1 Tax=Streptomyces sp. NBC_01465 TaxID=2903878 RepID=UPI002E342480|nr:glycosyltransferase family 2 protein [Streptomyces sp. NBC_01465]
MSGPAAFDFYAGAGAARILLVLALAVIVFGVVWTAMLFAFAARQRRHDRNTADETATPPPLLWVFVVPALNEEVTIADSVHRLFDLDVERRVVLVVDDGSQDRTPEILAGLARPGLVVLRRDLPEARKGKSEALNDAWRHIHSVVLKQGPHRGTGPQDVVMVIVDADGRLDAAAPSAIARRLADPRIGGVQSQVTIYNRSGFLTWCQDVEFAVYGRLYQLARSRWFIADMGGNGQFNRLSMLDEIAGADGPWRPALTEDQDLGLRLYGAGWRSTHEWRSGVSQQGLNNYRRLSRQRTRWYQGNLQALRHLGSILRMKVSFIVRIDLLWYITLPIQQLIVALALPVAVVLWCFKDLPFLSGPLWLVVLIYGLAFGTGTLGLLARSEPMRVRDLPKAFLMSVPYALYTWLIIPSLFRALFRLMFRRGGWVKTPREPISGG